MKCILHIGAEKTGSTSIQDSLFANREHLLRDQGTYVATNPKNANLTWLARAATLAAAGEVHDKRLSDKLQSLTEELEHARQKADRPNTFNRSCPPKRPLLNSKPSSIPSPTRTRLSATSGDKTSSW